jgi:hypothetical protein
MNLNFLKAFPLPKMVKDILTDDQGNYVPDKLLFVLVGLAFVGFAGWDLIILHHAFNPVAYGTGAGATLGGGGLGSLAMSHMKPNPPDGG